MNAALARAIAANRFVDVQIQIASCPAEGGIAFIRQESHAFLFGANMFELLSKKGSALTEYQARLSSLWNAGTLPFYLGSLEPQEGNIRIQGLLDAARWAHSQGIRLKGHPLIWHSVCPDWLLNCDTASIEARLMGRIDRELASFAGLIQVWDVVNEAVILPVFDRYDNAVSRLCRTKGRIPLIMEAFSRARQAAPEATLLINDFDLSQDYADLIQALLDKGCPVDAIGLQTHMHQGYRGEAYFETILERFARFGLPLHFSEATLLSGDLVDPAIQDLNDAKRSHWPSTPEGEERQAQEVEDFYSLIYAHPQTAAITWWDMEDGHWLNAPSGLLRRDGSPKPAWDTLTRLIKQDWWYPGSSHQVKPGQIIRIRAPEGSYTLDICGTKHSCEVNRTRPFIQV